MIKEKIISTRLLLGVLLAILAFAGYLIACGEQSAFISLLGFFSTLYGIYVTGNTSSKNTEIKSRGGSQ